LEKNLEDLIQDEESRTEGGGGGVEREKKEKEIVIRGKRTLSDQREITSRARKIWGPFFSQKLRIREGGKVQMVEGENGKGGGPRKDHQKRGG